MAMDFKKINAAIPPRDETAAQCARDRWNNIAKPIGSLGLLEDAIVEIAALTGTIKYASTDAQSSFLWPTTVSLKKVLHKQARMLPHL